MVCRYDKEIKPTYFTDGSALIKQKTTVKDLGILMSDDATVVLTNTLIM